ncbi:uncharacterized protein LY79DRAFT_572304 [Colletotrichum navitas]|uniref:Uncharacterized protein n=1 Tax=Colletotrichum navitas TaxID=681940 RepID=A0AAD8PL37_9PEZI|nr:uncharacterized protein LY79DRAFT_572304 [Colletotrichum navitas]KAK1566324.1 hypothetical protein LY79DRAFT_572304 [Colletotrichum navitas]
MPRDVTHRGFPCRVDSPCRQLLFRHRSPPSLRTNEQHSRALPTARTHTYTHTHEPH